MLQPTKHSVSEDGVERRATPRYTARLSAIAELDGVQQECEVLDFCLGGMFLAPTSKPDRDCCGSVALLTPGSIINITVKIPSVDGNTNLSFAARVARNRRGGVGVAFLDPDPAALRRIEKVVGRTAEAVEGGAGRDVPGASGNRVNEDTRIALLSHCKNIMAEQLASIMQTFLSKTTSSLAARISKAADNDEIAVFQQASNVLDASAYELEYRFSSTVLECVDDPVKVQTLIATRRDTDRSSGCLSLVEEDDFEDWLAIAETIYKLETRYQLELFELSSRLGCILNTLVDRENNPVGPTVLCHAFSDAVKPVQIDHKVKQLLFKYFQNVLVASLPEFYSVLNADLVKGHVLPDIASTLPSSLRESNTSQSHAVPKAPVDELPTVAQGSRFDNTWQGAAINEVAVTNQPGKPADGNHNVLSSALDLLNLASDRRSNREITSRHDTHQVTDIIQVLSHMQLSDGQNPPDVDKFISQLDTSLAAAPGGKSKHIGIKERNQIEVTERIIAALLEDRLISKSAKKWFHMLQLPLLKVALTDETFLHDKSHPARLLINKLAHLALSDDESSDAVDHGLQGMVSQLLGKLTGNSDGNVTSLKNIVQEFDVIVDVHKQTYTTNLNELIKQCEEEQSLLKNTREESIELTGNLKGGKAWARWINRALQLAPGDVLQFIGLSNNSGKASKQLDLAWIAKNKNKFVFVNQKGLKALSLSLNELAMYLRKGLALIVQDADKPAMDRAEYTMLQQLNQKLVFQAAHDELTGLLNRRELERIAKDILAENITHGVSSVLCMLQLAQLRLINTTCGYQAGDRVLKEVTRILVSAAPGAHIARLGSSEFAIFMQGRTEQEAIKITDKIVAALSAMKFRWKNKEFSADVFAGLVPVTAELANIESVMQHAEMICSEAKKKGSDRITVYRLGDDEINHYRAVLGLAASIEGMLDKNRLALRCQLISPINEADHLEAHYEVLLSVLDEKDNRLPPTEFIQAAEKYNRMPLVDRWVVREIFQWLGKHREQLQDFGGFAINLSGQSINDENFVDFIREQIAQTNVPMDKVCFEVTETVGVESIAKTVDFILELKKTGCQFSLDDFGTGMSSYAYLKNMPVDFLKVDGCFVRELDRNPDDYAVVKSVSEIGHFMNKKVIAEYVENEEIINKLKEIGVDYAQGYVLGKPVPLEELEIVN